jgi:DNA-binding NtrC family response regulator
MLLVIEPVDDVRELLVRFLARHGVRAIGSAGPRDASRWLRGRDVGVVIVSHDLWSGLPYSCPELQAADAPHTIVLATSPLDEHELAQRLGNFHCLQMKPFEPWQLCAAVLEANHASRRGQRLASGIISGPLALGAPKAAAGGNRGWS